MIFPFPKLIASQTTEIVIKPFLTNESLDEANVNMNPFPWHVCTLRHEALLKELTEQLTERNLYLSEYEKWCKIYIAK